MVTFNQLFSILITDYIWYHAFTITVVAVILCLIAIHRRGTDINLAIAK